MAEMTKVVPEPKFVLTLSKKEADVIASALNNLAANSDLTTTSEQRNVFYDVFRAMFYKPGTFEEREDLSVTLFDSGF